MDALPLITQVEANFSRIYLGGIPSLLNDDGAFLSFICSLTAVEALGGFLKPDDGNGVRFREFVKSYFPSEYGQLVDGLWKLRNATVHGFSPGPFALTHHSAHLHLSSHAGRVTLNAEDFYAALVGSSRRYFSDLRATPLLQDAFVKRTQHHDTGVLTVSAISD